MSNLIINTTSGVVTSNNNTHLNIVTQTGALGWGEGTEYTSQNVRDINRLTIHYTGSSIDGAFTTSLAGFNAWWNPTWHQPGYHFIIQENGTVWQTARVNRHANGAVSNNAQNIHIAIVGLFWDGVSPDRPTRNDGPFIARATPFSPQQRTALQRLVQGFINNSKLTLNYQ